MSRTRKGSKGVGWEPWSNRHERQKPAPDPGYVPTDAEYAQWESEQEAYDCYLMGGCPKCLEAG